MKAVICIRNSLARTVARRSGRHMKTGSCGNQLSSRNCSAKKSLVIAQRHSGNFME
jgi:hypothetical protein